MQTLKGLMKDFREDKIHFHFHSTYNHETKVLTTDYKMPPEVLSSTLATIFAQSNYTEKEFEKMLLVALYAFRDIRDSSEAYDLDADDDDE